MPFQAVVAATCFCAAFGSILMGVVARYPIALAPGMGLNAYFTYTVVKGMGIPWQTALGAVFLSGVAFLMLTFAGIRQLIMEAIPHGTVCGGGGGDRFVHRDDRAAQRWNHRGEPGHFGDAGKLRDKNTLWRCLDCSDCRLLAWGVRAAMLIGILATTLAGARWAGAVDAGNVSVCRYCGHGREAGHSGGAAHWAAGNRFRVSVRGSIRQCRDAGGRGQERGAVRCGQPHSSDWADSAVRCYGDHCGVAGRNLDRHQLHRERGGRGGGGAQRSDRYRDGLLFILALFVAPLVGAVPTAATAPALIVVGSLMMSHLAEIAWNDPAMAIPAFLTLMTIPLTFSIANGLAFGFTSYAVLQVARGEFRETALAGLRAGGAFIARFIYLGVELALGSGCWPRGNSRTFPDIAGRLFDAVDFDAGGRAIEQRQRASGALCRRIRCRLRLRRRIFRSPLKSSNAHRRRSVTPVRWHARRRQPHRCTVGDRPQFSVDRRRALPRHPDAAA